MKNPVTVEPGGASFATIQDAIDSIDDASEKRQYTVLCSPGTYHESITLKPWVYVEGIDQLSDSAVIINEASMDSPGTVHGASNSGITACTIISTATVPFASPCAVSCNGVQNFTLTGCKIYTKDAPGANKGAICTVALNFYENNPPPASMTISNCEIHQECAATPTGPSMEAVAADRNSKMEVYGSKITCIGSSDYAGALVSTGGEVVVSISDLSCPDMALDIDQYTGGSLKAIDCKIDGKVGKEVVVSG